MREIVDVGSSSLLTISTGSDASQQSEIISRGNRAVHRYRVKRRTRSKERRNSRRGHVPSPSVTWFRSKCERVFPAGVGPGSPSRDAADWLPSRVSQSIETRRRYGWLRMVFPVRASSELQFGALRKVWRHARGREHCRGAPGSALSGGYAPDWGKVEGSSIVAEPGEYYIPVRENQRREPGGF